MPSLATRMSNESDEAGKVFLLVQLLGRINIPLLVSLLFNSSEIEFKFKFGKVICGRLIKTGEEEGFGCLIQPFCCCWLHVM